MSNFFYNVPLFWNHSPILNYFLHSSPYSNFWEVLSGGRKVYSDYCSTYSPFTLIKLKRRSVYSYQNLILNKQNFISTNFLSLLEISSCVLHASNSKLGKHTSYFIAQLLHQTGKTSSYPKQVFILANSKECNNLKILF